MASSPPPPPPPPSLSSLRDAVDSLLESYLAALESYQSARATLHAHLKHGYLDLARAKLALGPARVGPRSYDLSDQAAQLGVVLEATTGDEEAEERPQVGTQAGAVSWTVGARAQAPAPGAVDLDPEDGATPAPDVAPSTLRRRARRPSASSLDAADASTSHRAHSPSRSPSPSPSPSVAPAPAPAPPRSPLAQFSPLPPPALRSAASSFAAGAHAAARVVECERALREWARRVKRARREVAAAVAAGAGAGAAAREGREEGEEEGQVVLEGGSAEEGGGRGEAGGAGEEARAV